MQKIMTKQTSAILLIKLSNSNIFFTVTSLNGKILNSVSTGQFKSKGVKKITLNSLKSCSLALNYSLKTPYKLHIKFKGLSKYKRLILKLLIKNLTHPILSFCDVTSLPHNGVKITKPRRI